jgi:hypothetical protein
VIQRAVVADHRRLADDHTHAVVDEHPLAYGGPGMDLDAGEPACEMRKEARQPAHARTPQPVGDPMQGQRMEAGIAGQHLPGGTGGGVAFENAGDIFTQTGEHEPIFY